MTMTTVSSGQMVSNVTIASGDSETVLSGGSSIDPQVVGGSLELEGGFASSAFIVSSGSMRVSAGGSAVDTVVSGGFVEVLSGGSANGTTVESGGFLKVLGEAFGTQVSSGGYLGISGTTSGLLILSGGSASGGRFSTASQTIVENGGTFSASDLGTVDNLVVSAGGTFIDNSATISDVTISSGGLFVYEGGTRDGVTLLSGALEYDLNILSGQTVSGGTISGRFYTQEVALGGEVIDFTFSGFTKQIVGPEEATGDTGSAITIGITLEAGSTQYVLSGGFASGTDVGSRAIQRIGMMGFYPVPGGTATNTVIEAGGAQIDAGIASGTVVRGVQEVEGVALDTTVESRGIQLVASYTAQFGQSSFVTSALASNTIVESGGIELLRAGGVAIDTTVSSGGYFIYSGGTVSNLDLLPGAQEMTLIVSGGTVSREIISGKYTQRVESRGKTVNLTFSGGSTQALGGTAVRTKLKVGTTQNVQPAGRASGTQIGAGAVQNVDIGDIVKGVVASGVAMNTTIEAGGIQNDYAIASTTTVKGNQFIGSGGRAINTTVEHGGTQTVFKGTASATTIENGGKQIVDVSGAAAGTTLDRGGTLVVSGGTVTGLIAKAGGIVAFNGAGKVTDSQKTNITFSVSGFSATDTLDLAGYKFSKAEKLSFVENAAKTQGVLTIKDGALKTRLTLFGNHVAAGFHISASGAGTVITYKTPAAHEPAISVTHS